MEGKGEIETQALEFEKLEEILKERDGDVFDPIFSFGLVHELKVKLQAYKDQGTDLHSVYKSEFHHFFPDQTLNLFDFVSWCALNYSSSERVIMDVAKSKILF